MDVKKNIYDLAMNRIDTQIAIVENQGTYDSVQESIVRLYDVGRRRDDEDEVEDEDEEEELDGSDDGSEIDNSDDPDVTEENSQNLQNLLDEIARDVDELQGNEDPPGAEERNEDDDDDDDDDSALSLGLMDDSSTDVMDVNIEDSDTSGDS